MHVSIRHRQDRRILMPFLPPQLAVTAMRALTGLMAYGHICPPGSTPNHSRLALKKSASLQNAPCKRNKPYGAAFAPPRPLPAVNNGADADSQRSSDPLCKHARAQIAKGGGLISMAAISNNRECLDEHGDTVNAAAAGHGRARHRH